MPSEVATFFVCGDIINKERTDGLVCSEGLSEIINSADYAVCNFEAPIKGYGKPEPKPGVHHCQIAETITGLKKQGFSLLLLANNHMFDFGKPALAATLRKAKDNNLDTLGAGLNSEEAYLPLIKIINGLKIGMLNACEAQYGEINSEGKEVKAGYAWISDPIIEKNIIKLRKECDFVFVFSHAGLEHFPIPQREWRTKYRHFCDLGADIVIGAHPHVPQGFEKYGKSIIFYSLGNFYFNKGGSSSLSEDSSFAVWLDLKKNGGFEYKLVHHFKKYGLVQVAPSTKQADIKKLNVLLEDDFYWKAHEKMTIDTYNKIKRGLAISAFLPVPLNGSFKSFIRLIASSILKRDNVKYKDLYQLHLLKNESYYYVLKHALELLTQRKYHR